MNEEKIDIYNTKRILQNHLDSIQNSKDISTQNKQILLKTKNDFFAEGLSVHRINKYLTLLKVIAKQIQLKTAKKEDLKKFLAWLEEKSHYAEATKKDFKVTLKKFYKEKPELTAWFKCKMKRNQKKLPSELLTEEELLNLIRNTTNSRDRAMISFMAETGARISECAGILIKDCSFDEFGGKVRVRGKTGERILRIVSSSKDLQNWLNKHPLKNKESPVWIRFSDNRKVMCYNSFVKVVKAATRKSGIKKRVYNHLFRHSAASRLAGNPEISEQVLKSYMGWTEDSAMLKTYISLNAQQVDDSFLRMHGLKQKHEEKKSKLYPIKCVSCSTLNNPEALYCEKCRAALSLEVALQKDSEEKINYEIKLKEMQEKMKLFEEFMKSKK